METISITTQPLLEQAQKAHRKHRETQLIVAMHTAFNLYPEGRPHDVSVFDRGTFRMAWDGPNLVAYFENFEFSSLTFTDELGDPRTELMAAHVCEHGHTSMIDGAFSTLAGFGALLVQHQLLPRHFDCTACCPDRGYGLYAAKYFSRAGG